MREGSEGKRGGFKHKASKWTFSEFDHFNPPGKIVFSPENAQYSILCNSLLEFHSPGRLWAALIWPSESGQPIAVDCTTDCTHCTANSSRLYCTQLTQSIREFQGGKAEDWDKKKKFSGTTDYNNQ